MVVRALGGSVLVAALALTIAGCSTGSSGASVAGQATSTVEVALQEWAVVPAAPGTAAGQVTFEVSNSGPKDIHELVVIRTDVAPGELPTTSVGSVDEAAAGLTVVGEVTSMAPGASGSITVDLSAGRYVLICNVVEDLKIHYELGMRTAFEVTQ